MVIGELFLKVVVDVFLFTTVGVAAIIAGVCVWMALQAFYQRVLFHFLMWLFPSQWGWFHGEIARRLEQRRERKALEYDHRALQDSRRRLEIESERKRLREQREKNEQDIERLRD